VINPSGVVEGLVNRAVAVDEIRRIAAGGKWVSAIVGAIGIAALPSALISMWIRSDPAKVSLQP